MVIYICWVIYGLYMKIYSTLAFITVLLTSNLHKLSKEILNSQVQKEIFVLPGVSISWGTRKASLALITNYSNQPTNSRVQQINLCMYTWMTLAGLVPPWQVSGVHTDTAESTQTQVSQSLPPITSLLHQTANKPVCTLLWLHRITYFKPVEVLPDNVFKANVN